MKTSHEKIEALKIFIIFFMNKTLLLFGTDTTPLVSILQKFKVVSMPELGFGNDEKNFETISTHLIKDDVLPVVVINCTESRLTTTLDYTLAKLKDVSDGVRHHKNVLVIFKSCPSKRKCPFPFEVLHDFFPTVTEDKILCVDYDEPPSCVKLCDTLSEILNKIT